MCRTLKPRVRTLVDTTEKLAAQASLRPGNTSLGIVFVSAAKPVHLKGRGHSRPWEQEAQEALMLMRWP